MSYYSTTTNFHHTRSQEGIHSKTTSSNIFQERTPRTHSQVFAKKNPYGPPDNDYMRPKQALKMKLRRIVGSNQSSLPTVTQGDSQLQTKPDQSKTQLKPEYRLCQDTHSVANLNILTHPGLDSMYQDWWSRNTGSILKPQTSANARPNGFNMSATPDMAASQYRKEAWVLPNHKFSTPTNVNILTHTRPSPMAFEEEATLLRSGDRKTPSIKKVIGKDNHAPARVFTFIKHATPTVNRNAFISESSIYNVPNTSYGLLGDSNFSSSTKGKKPTVLAMMKEKILESVTKSSRIMKTPNRIKPRKDSPQQSSLQPIEIPATSVFPSPKFITTVSTTETLRDRDREYVVPLHKGLSSPGKYSGVVMTEQDNIRAETMPSEPSSNKKLNKMPRNFVSNFSLARIEKEALKEMRKKHRTKEIVKKEKIFVAEDLESPPLKLHQIAKNPLFDDCESERLQPKKQRNKEDIERDFSRLGKSFRKRLVRLLNKMKRLKITPKDLMTNENIFSQLPYEKHGSKKLIEAARVGDLRAIEKLFEDYPRFLVHDFDHIHQTPLHWAARKGFCDIVKLLVRKGADVNAKDIVGRTPLFFALKYSHTSVVRILLACRADPWSTKDCNYKELSQDNPEVIYYLARARQLHIIMRMTAPNKRDELWEKEAQRLVVNLNFNIDEV